MSIRFNHRTGLIEAIGTDGVVVYDSGETDSFTIKHDGSDVLLESSSNASVVYLQVTGGSPFTTGSFNVKADIDVTGDIRTNDAAGASVLNETASGTNPTLIPNRGDTTTGIGSTGAGGVSIITSGVERVSTGTVTHTILLNTYINQPGAGPGLQIGDGDMADQDVLLRLNSDAPYGFIQDGDAGTAKTAFKAFTNDDFTIQNSSGTDVFTFTVTSGNLAATSFTASSLTDNDILIAGASGLIEDSGGKVTYDGSSFAAYGDGTATDLHYLGIDTNDRFRFECGTNYGMILYEDNNVSTENSFFYIGNDTVSTGTQSIFFRKGGSDWFQADNFGSASRFEFTGPLEIAGTTDHVGDTGLGTGVSSDRIQIWAKSRSLDHEPMITTGDQDLDYTFTNVNVMSYHHDQTTASADPGAGNIRWNSLTPASVTNLYIDDLESTGRDASFMLANLADGDILTIRATWDAADYLVCSVNGTPTDNTGWWTVPVTIIHSGAGAPTTGDPIHIGVEWMSQAPGGGGITGTVANNQVVTGTGASTVDSSANLTFDGSTLALTGALTGTGTLSGFTSIEGITSANLVDKTAAETITGIWDFTTAQSQHRYGIGGDYSSTSGDGTWGATIWSLDTTWQGGTAGANSANTSVYGVRWLRTSHANADSNVGEGLYGFVNGTRYWSIGQAGQSLSGALTFLDSNAALNCSSDYLVVNAGSGSVTGLRMEYGAGTLAGYLYGDANGLYLLNSAGSNALLNPIGTNDLRIYGEILSTDLTQPWLSLDSTSAGDNWTAQGAGISVGESGKKGSAAIHLTYNGDGSGYLGMGTVDNTAATGGRPTYGHFDFTYNSPNIYTGGLLFPGASDGTTGSSLIQTTSYMESCQSQNYGSINVTGASGTSGTYSGYSINRRVVFMNNGSTTSGIYNDTNNEWFFTMVENGAMNFYHNGVSALATQAYNSTGITSSALVYDHGNVARDVGFNTLDTFNLDASDTLEASHCGKVTGKTNTSLYTLTGPTSSDLDFPVGGVCTVMNLGTSGNYLISDTTTCTIYMMEGDGTAPADIVGTCTLGPGGVATLWRYSSTAIYIWGSGLTL